jgi:DNA sulfur modification protein DndB
MQIKSAHMAISGMVGLCGDREVFVGFAPAKTLHMVSFADTLNEDTGIGYQRPRDRGHSLDFKRYISTPGASTIPLTFNLRQDLKKFWRIEREGGMAVLWIKPDAACLAQVDCQHRLGELADSDVNLAFMAFIGLDLRGEMAMFTIINSKVRGLQSSLTDFHESNLIENLVQDAPQLFLARQLNENCDSPWFKMIRYGGETSSGMRRRTSLRMMQTAIRHLLTRIRTVDGYNVNGVYNLLLNYWGAVAYVFDAEWQSPREHLLTKGVGLHALTELLGTIVQREKRVDLSRDEIIEKLKSLKENIDWGRKGTFADAGGRKGASAAHETLRKSLGI